MLKLTIDCREIEVSAGTKVIEAAEQLGIMIPRFCYHPALGSVGACRVCAVAFTDGPVKGIQMSCMVNAQDGMVVSTSDDEAVDFRRHVIEWLMLHHPHDCPVCDEGGHCLLQDLTVSGGHGLRRYQGLKRTHNDQYLGPLIKHEMNRCIQCYRCARYYQEFTGTKDLGVLGIGSRVYFGRSKPGVLESPFSGNLIDICPTGVYTDKPSRYIGRRWDFERAPSICVHCSLGCNLVASAQYRRVVRHEARINLDVNGHFICDRGRYGYPYTDSETRPRQANVKGARQSLSDALEEARLAIDQIVQQHGSQSVAAVGSVRSSLETLAALDCFCRDMKCRGPAVAHESRKAFNLHAATRSLTAELAVSLGAVSVADFVLIIGADPINEAPMLALSLRQAQRQGGRVAVIDPRAVEMPMDFDHLPTSPANMVAVIRHMIDAACGTDKTDPKPSLSDNGRLDAITSGLCNSRRAVIICGTDMTTPHEILLSAKLSQILRNTGTETKLFYPLNGPNAFAAGRLIDDSGGIEAQLSQIESGRIKAWVVVENDLWHHYPDRGRLTRAIAQLELFILLDYVASPLMNQADIVLPTQTLYEAGGHWINQEGRLQSAAPVLAGGASIERVGRGDHPPRVIDDTIPEGTPAAAWKLLTALGNRNGEEDLMHADDFTGTAMDKAVSILGGLHDGNRISLSAEDASLSQFEGRQAFHLEENRAETYFLLLVDRTIGTEGLSASAAALAEVASSPAAVLHPCTANRFGLVSDGRMTIKTAGGKLSLAWQPDDRMAHDTIILPRHHQLDWQVLGATRLVLEPKDIIAEK